MEAEREDLARVAGVDPAPVDPVPASPAAETPAGEALLRALLHIPQRDAAIIRDATPARIRPSRQHGPTADYGVAE